MIDPPCDGNPQANYIHVVPGSARWFCRADNCFAYSDGNVPYGYCDRHLAQAIAGSPIKDKFGYPPVGGFTTGADSADSEVPRTVNGEARDPQSSSAASSADPLPSERDRKQCACAIPDPVMQADVRFYCHRCSFQVAAVLCADCRQRIVALAAADPALRTLSQRWKRAAQLFSAPGDDPRFWEGYREAHAKCAADLDRLCPEIRDEQKEQGDQARGRTQADS